MEIPTLDETQETPMARRDFLKMAATVGGSLLAVSSLGSVLSPAQACPTHPPKAEATAGLVASAPVMIEAKNFDAHLATVEGLSPTLLKQHLGLYQGYVKKINEIEAALHSATPDPTKVNPTYDPYRELHVEQTFALNGVVLHELYFGNLGGAKAAPSEAFKATISQNFGSWDQYVNHLKASGKGARGWVMTAYNPRDGKIHNYGLDTHNQGVPFGVVPLLVLDVYEHAYIADFGTNRASYLDVFMNNINWAVVEERLPIKN